jgi:UDP-N-acetyl-D-mannosaminuronate dehydrogenase
MNVVIGLGEIGRPLFEILQAKEPEMRGIDIEPVALDAPVGIMHVCFPFTPNSGFVETSVQYARKYKPEIIVVNSTVVPGTTRDIEKQSGVPTVYSPVRGKHTRMRDDLKKYRKFVAGTSSVAVERVAQHFSGAGLATQTVTPPEALELSKLLETTYFGLLISWAQEMDRFAKQVGAEYTEVVKLFEEVDYLPKHIFQPGYIGGHCVMPNIELLKTQFTSEVLAGIEASNVRKGKALAAEDVQRALSKDRARVEPIKVGK